MFIHICFPFRIVMLFCNYYRLFDFVCQESEFPILRASSYIDKLQHIIKVIGLSFLYESKLSYRKLQLITKIVSYNLPILKASFHIGKLQQTIKQFFFDFYKVRIHIASWAWKIYFFFIADCSGSSF